MKKSITLVFFLLLLIQLPAQKYGQALTDSMIAALPAMKEDTNKVKALIMLVYELHQSDFSIAEKYSQQSIAMAKKIQWPKGEANAYYYLAANNLGQSNYAAAVQNTLWSLQIFQSIKDQRGISMCYILLSQCYSELGQYDQCLKYVLQSLKLDETLDNLYGLVKDNDAAGRVYCKLKKFDKAISYGEKAVALANKLNDPEELNSPLNNLANAYMESKNYSKAKAYYLQSLAIAQKIEAKISIGILYGNLGEVKLAENDFEGSLQSYKKALEIFEPMQDKENMAWIYGGISETNLHLARNTNNVIEKNKFLQLAASYCSKDIALSKQVNYRLHQLIADTLLCAIKSLQGDYKGALAVYKEYTANKDSLFTEDSKQTVKNLEDKRTIDLKDKEIEISNLKILSQQKQRWMYLAGIALLFIIGILLYVQSRSRKKANRILTSVNTKLDDANAVKTKLFSIISHDLRSPLANLLNFLHLQKEAPDLLDANAVKAHQQRITSSTQNLLHTMEELLLWSKGQMNHFVPQKKMVAVYSLFVEITNLYQTNNGLKFELEGNESIQIFTDENYLKTIIRNLTTNAIKAAGEHTHSLVQLTSWKTNQHTCISIADNGTGMPQENKEVLLMDNSSIKNGLGLHLVRDLAKAIDCSIQIDNNKPTGTIVTLIFKQPK